MASRLEKFEKQLTATPVDADGEWYIDNRHAFHGGLRMNILFYAYLAFFLFIFPVSACFLLEKNKQPLHGGRELFAILLYSLLSWCVTNGVIYLRYLQDPTGFRGPEGAFALLFGWIYLWITSIPVFLIYLTFKIISRMVKKQK